MDIVVEKMLDTLISYSTNSLRQVMARKIGGSILIDESSIDKKILIWREIQNQLFNNSIEILIEFIKGLIVRKNEFLIQFGL